MSEVQKAVDKLIAEINKNKNSYVEYVGEKILDILQASNSEEIAGKMLVEGKTIQGSYEAMAKEARKIATNGMAVLSPEHGFKIIGDYFDIDFDNFKLANACENQKNNVVEVDFKRDTKEIDIDLDDLF